MAARIVSHSNPCLDEFLTQNPNMNGCCAAALKYFWNARKIVQNKYQNIRVKQKNPFFKKSADIIHLMGILHVIYYNCINILKTK